MDVSNVMKLAINMHNCPKRPRVAAIQEPTADEQMCEAETDQLVEQLAAQQMVGVAFIVNNKCTVYRVMDSLFDSGSSHSFISRASVPVKCESLLPSVYKGMGGAKLNSFGKVKCAIKFRNHVFIHDFVILPDTETFVPIIIGRDL